MVRWPDWFEFPEVLGRPPWSLSQSEAQNLLRVLLDSMRTDRPVELLTQGNVLLNWDDLGLQTSQMSVRIGPPNGRQKLRSWDGKRGKRVHFLSNLLTKTNNGLAEDVAVQQAIGLLRSVWDSARQCDDNAPSPRDRLLISTNDGRRLNPDWWRLHIVSDDSTIFQCDICGRIQERRSGTKVNSSRSEATLAC